MVTQSPSLHPASLNMGTAANPSGQCAAEAVRLAAAALIYMHGTGDAGNAVDPSQRCLSPDIFQEDVTQASEACYDGDPTLSAVQELHDGPWDSLIPPDTSFGLTDFIPDGVCGDVASSVSSVCLCNDGCDIFPCNDACDICLRSGECDDTVSQGACWEQGVDFAGLTPLDVCLAKHTLDLDLFMKPLDATSLEEAFAELDAERHPAQALSSASPTLPVNTPATSAERGPRRSTVAGPLSNDSSDSCAPLSLPSPPPATQARRLLPTQGRPREARQRDQAAALSQRVVRTMGGKQQPKTGQRQPGRGAVKKQQGAVQKRQRASVRRRTPQQCEARQEYFLASAVTLQRNNIELVFKPQRRSQVWVSDASPERIEFEPRSSIETAHGTLSWIDVHPGGTASFAVRLCWSADQNVFCGQDEIRGKRLAISFEMAQALLLAVGKSQPLNYESVRLLSGSITRRRVTRT